jgi:phosphoglucosamine mutase
MSNMGLEKYLGGLGLSLERTNVGDRYVLERMRNDGFNVGGEQSGHIILSDYSTTGDGLVAGLQVLAALVQAERPANQVLNLFTPFPQILKNVRVPAAINGMVLDNASVKASIAAGEKTLQGSGRVLIRKSGTEPLIRVMAEGENQTQVANVVDSIAEAIESAAK